MKVQLYCDGACSSNGSDTARTGAGIVLIEEGLEPILRSVTHATILALCTKYGTKPTNNTAELTAIGIGLSTVTDPKETDLELVTDSEYAAGLLKNEYKAKANVSMVTALRALLTKFKSVTITHTMGHAGNHWNEVADSLAVAAKTATEDHTVQLGGF